MDAHQEQRLADVLDAITTRLVHPHIRVGGTDHCPTDTISNGTTAGLPTAFAYHPTLLSKKVAPCLIEYLNRGINVVIELGPD